MPVFHLKYRPTKLKDLDLKSAASALVKIFSSKEIPQSFLFAGPKGAGKTSAARIVALVLNCTKKKGVEPCLKCANCKEIMSGGSIDIIEIDAASNRGIDDVRGLKDKAYLVPSKLERKVFIIDEVHMLTKEAFNALLKLLEEPPEHTFFVLCTTDPGKIPETVLSRLLRVDFRKGNKEELRRCLLKVIKGEGIKVPERAVDLIIDQSDGSFRNLHKMFNELYLEQGKRMSLKGVKEFFSGRIGEYRPEDFEDDLVAGEAKAILLKMEAMASAGVDFSAWRKNVLDFFQKRLLAFYGVGDSSMSKASTRQQQSGLSLKELVRLLNLFLVAGRQEKEVEIDQLPLQLLVVEFLRPKADKEKKEEVRVFEKAEKRKRENKKIEAKKEVVVKVATKVGGQVTVEQIEGKWAEVLLAVKPFNHSVEAFLRACRPKQVEGDTVLFEVFYPFHQERLSEPKNKRIVEKGLADVFGVELMFDCVLSKRRGRPVVVKNESDVERKVEDKVDEKELYDVAKEIFG